MKLVKKFREMLGKLRKPKGDGINRYEYRNYNATNTCIHIAISEGAVVTLHVDSPNPETTEAMFKRVKNDILNELEYGKTRRVSYAT